MTPEEIFEHCWQEVEAGRKTPEECVAQFPQVPELAEQLQNLRRLRALNALTLSPQANRRLEAKLKARLKAKHPPQAFGLLPSWSWASMVLVILAFASAALWVTHSVPGEAVYPIKRTVEQAQITLALPNEHSSLYAELATRRVEEMSVLVAQPTVPVTTLAAVLAEATEYTHLSLSTISRLPPERRAEVLRQILLSLEQQTRLIAHVEANISAELAPQLTQAAEAALENTALANTYYAAATGGANPTETLEANASPSPAPQLPSATPVAQTATAQPSATLLVPTNTATAVAPTHTATVVPPTFTATAVPPTRTPSTVPPTATVQPTNTLVPPTSTSAPPTAPGNSDCAAQNPNSPRYCTPTPAP